MPRLEARWSGAEADASLFRPRADLVLEREVAPGRFAQEEGPFTSYERTVLSDADGGLTETTTYRLAIPWFGWVFALPTRRGLRRRPLQRPHGGRQPWWAPPQRLDARAAHVLGLLAAGQVIAGFGSTVFSQTVAFAADEFGASEGAQGVAGSVIRLGIVFSVVLLALTDRIGRRRVLVGCALAAPIGAAAGALAPSFAALTVIQTLARPLSLALALVISIVAAEEMPPGSRAYAVSLLGLAYALGAGTCVWVLPLADVGERGWRLVFGVGLVYLLVARSLARGVPESRRYELPHAEHAPLPRRRFLLLGASAFLYNILIAPTTFYENRYLKDARGYSATLIAVYTIVTATPGVIGIVAGGRLADVRGRRLVGTIALIAVAVGNVVVFSTTGTGLWVAKTVTTILAAMAVPALGVYAAELFPTSRRGGANGGISALSIVGSIAGLLLAGALLDRGATYGTVVSILALGPLVYAALVVVAYPETARRSLDDINPEDRPVKAP